MQAFNSERELTNCFLDLLLKYPNVVGIDGELRPKIKNGKTFKKSMAIRVYVSKKIPATEFVDTLPLSSSIKRKIVGGCYGDRYLKEDLIPIFINDIPTDVVEMGEAYALNNIPKVVIAPRPIVPKMQTQGRYRSLLAGTSATHYQSSACTLNCLFLEKDTGRLMLASNNHCFGRENTAKVGDPILQPSPYDGGRLPEDQIGEFYKSIEIKFIQYKSSLRNTVHKVSKKFKPQEAFFNRSDVAFASLKCQCRDCKLKCNPILNKCAIEVFSAGVPIGKKLPDLNDKVQKIGRTTGKTVGRVISTSWTGTVKYSRGAATFIDCILVSGKNFSLGGDSGSPVLDMEGNYIGILFAGSGDHSIICKYTNIEKEGNCELVILPPEIKFINKKKEIKKVKEKALSVS